MNQHSVNSKVEAELSKFDTLELIETSHQWEEQLVGNVYSRNSKHKSGIISYKVMVLIGFFLAFNISFFLNLLLSKPEKINNRSELYNSVSEQFLVTPTLSDNF